MNNHCNGVHSSSPQTANSSSVPPKRDSQNGQNLNWFIYLMFARRNFQQCGLIIEECLKLNFDLEYPYFVKGLLAREEEKYSEAIKYFQKSIESNSKSSNGYREIAKTLYLMGRHRQSLEIFVKTESLLKCADCELFHYIGKLLSKNVLHNKLSKSDAKDYYVKAILAGKHSDSMTDLAEIYLKEGDIRKSIEMLESSLQTNNDDLNTVTKVGILHLMLGDTQVAFTKLLDALVLDQNNPKILLALGGILQARGDIDGALNKYQNIDDLENQGSELWSNLGLCFIKKDKLIAAISCLRKSANESALNFNTYFNLGYVFIKAKLYLSAFHAFASAINVKPQNAECYMLIGICLANLNDNKNALVAFEKATMLPEAIKNPLIYLNFSIYCYLNHIHDKSYMQLKNFMGVIESDKRGRTNKEHLRIARNLMGLLNSIMRMNGSEGFGSAAVATTPLTMDINDSEPVEASDYVVEGRELESENNEDLTSARDDDQNYSNPLATGASITPPASPPTPERNYEFVTVVADVERQIDKPEEEGDANENVKGSNI